MEVELKNAILCGLLLTFAAACGDGDDFDMVDDYDEVDEATVATADALDWQSTMVYPMTDPFEDPFYYDDPFYLTVPTEAPVGDPDRAAEAVAEAADLYFMPADCAAVDRDGPMLTYSMVSCSGPFGHEVDGAMNATFSDADGGIGFEFASEALQIDGHDVELSGEGVYRNTDGSKRVEYTADQVVFADMDLRGSFTSVISWTGGSNCVTRNATGQLDMGGQAWDLLVNAYERCAGHCPSSGAVMASNSEGAWSLTFDGTAQAMLERPDGSSEAIMLDCEQ